MNATMMLSEPASTDDGWMLALNNSHAVETSDLTTVQLRTLIAGSFRTRVVRPDRAMCIAFDQTATYSSPNFVWFQRRLERFVYVDRIIVADHSRGGGLARALYADLTEAARSAGHDRLCCEVNTHPANPASEAFHEALGFVEAGTAHLPERGKSVRYLVRDLQVAG